MIKRIINTLKALFYMHALGLGMLQALFLIPLRTEALEAQAHNDEVMVAFDHGSPLATGTLKVNGDQVQVWQASTQNNALTFQSPSASLLPPASTLYLKVTYLDRGYGRLTVLGRGIKGEAIRPDKFTRIVFSDTGKWVTSYLRLNDVPNTGISSIQVGLERTADNVLVISQAVIRDEPFTDAHFQYILQEAWKRPYAGPSSPGIDNGTLKGKVMVGYQGWFRTPNDPYDRGWIHWGDMAKGQFKTDMWPDVTAYPEEALDKAGDVKTLSGNPAYLFSSAWPEVVRTHFAWMRENKIDGAFVQRFLGGLYAVNGQPEWVLDNVRAAANQEGRVWAVEYDVSGYPDAKLLDTLRKDWTWMVDDFGVKSDPSYAHEGGKPVVFIWGMPFEDRNISPATANAVVEFFKNDPTYGGNYVIGGIPSRWRKSSPEWQEHFRKYDGVLSWMSKSYNQDVEDFKAIGVDYYPHVWPGFSWANLKHLPTGATEQFTPRAGGRFYEGLFSKAAQAGADRLFVGMFDEYDESTAIMPMSDDPPPTPKEAGTMVKFFANPQMQEQPETITKPQVEIAFDGAAPVPKISPTHYLMRWEGQILPPADGNYVLEVEGAPGDSATLWIGGGQVLKVDSFGNESVKTATVTMNAGQMVVYRLDYLHADASGTMRLVWQGPGIERQGIPASALVDAWGRFITNEGHPSSWWLNLTEEAKEMVSGQRSPNDLSIK